MGIFSKKDTAASFPVDADNPFRPTKAIYVKEGNEFALSITLADITSLIPEPLLSVTTADEPTLLETATSTDLSTAPTLLKLTRTSRFASNWTATNFADTKVADLTNPLLSLGKWTITFPAKSAHSNHDILLHPAGFMMRSDEFVKDSVPYFWDVLDGRKLCKLYKAVEGKKCEIARFIGASARDRDGVLLVDDAQLDEVVVGLTCVAVLNRSDSFRA
ncbi:hypothetical protein B0H63DRAFT_63113 [Podospora didyma]|uniref:Uncharacterized protein n=1 Tax=Podospora didyma TaxID=330526 RepID=A0AAE0P7Z8_9PEZI|nr:hypothetical protein B0H63DRAFT_63113 [Podospora didyma]